MFDHLTLSDLANRIAALLAWKNMTVSQLRETLERLRRFIPSNPPVD